MDPRINIITLGVKDLDRAIKFYEIGLKLPRLPTEDEGIAFFNLHGSWLSLFPWESLAEDAQVEPNGSGFRGITLAHNVKTEAEVIATLKEAKQAGAQIVKTGQKTSWGGFSGYFADPDEHLWEVAFNPFFLPGPAEQ